MVGERWSAVSRCEMMRSILPWAAVVASASLAWEPLPPRATPRMVDVHNAWSRQVPYADALKLQRQLLAERTAALREPSRGSHADCLLLVQHPPVFTLGTRSSLDNLRSSSLPFELYRTERGGEVTYHGPGQLVLYPIIDLRHYRQDVHWYLRSLEEVALRVLRSLQLPARREPGLTGAWVDDAKVCATGVKLSRWVTMHGLALNVDVDLSHFEHIVPCGIADRPVTSILKELVERGGTVQGARVDPVGARVDDGYRLMAHVQQLLLRHFAEVFRVELSCNEELYPLLLPPAP